ncbi:MAG: glutaredoxin domain-containing protein [Gammaproteobacteria bacterium]|nr:glutaredoxin domain-containing protein [Gammaproteobacteria bacterium]
MLESKEGQKVPDVEFRARHAHEWIDLSSSELISMLVRDGVVEKMFVEPELEGDPYEVSDADTMLGYIAPAAHKPAEATIFSRKGCAHCVRAKQTLDHAEIAYEELVLDRDFTDRSLRSVTGRTTFPQVFINGKLVGRADELETWIKGRKAA